MRCVDHRASSASLSDHCSSRIIRSAGASAIATAAKAAVAAMFRRGGGRGSLNYQRSLQAEPLESRQYLSTLPLNPSFGAGGTAITSGDSDGGGTSICVQSDGKIVAGGFLNDSQMFAVARYNADGTSDSTFGNNGVVSLIVGTQNGEIDSCANSVVEQPDGKIVAGGYGEDAELNPELALVRLNSNGTLDSSFGNGGVVIDNRLADVATVMLEPDGTILVAGETSGTAAPALARYNADGTIDSSFGDDGIAVMAVSGTHDLSSATLLSNGEIAGAGSYSDGAGFVARFNPDGSLDTTFDTTGIASLPSSLPAVQDLSCAVDSAGDIFVSGGIAAMGDGMFVTKFNSEGAVDSAFAINGTFTTASLGIDCDGDGLALDANGRIYVSGWVDDQDGKSDILLARLSAEGSLDSAFGAGGIVESPAPTGDMSEASASAVTVLGDGNIVVAGTIGDDNSNPAIGIQEFIGGLPSGWTDADLGSPSIAGEAVSDGTTWIQTGSGAGIGDDAPSGDQANFLSESVSGDFAIIAQVNTLTDTSSMAEAGVMFRAGASANSDFVAVVATPAEGTRLYWRDGSYTANADGSPNEPDWVKISRVGAAYYGYYSTDGTNWTQIGTPMGLSSAPAGGLGGLIVDSHGTSLATATFTNVSVTSTTPSALPNGWSDTDIGTTQMAGSAEISSNTWSVVGNGYDIGTGTSDSFNYLSEAATGNVTVQAQIQSTTNPAPSADAKAGIMIRADDTPSAAFAAVVDTSAGIQFRWRTAAGLSCASQDLNVGLVPVWVRLVETNGSMHAYYSTDDSTWAEFSDTRTVTLPSTFLAGFAVASHNTNRLNIATFNGLAGLSATVTPISDQNVTTGMPLTLSTSFTDPAIQAPTVMINWGDGTTSNSADPTSGLTVTDANGSGAITASHTYQSSGTYSATMTVTDSDGESSTVTFNVTAGYTPPDLGMAISPNSVLVGTPISLALHNYVSADANSVTQWLIDWGDGSPEQVYSALPTRSVADDTEWDVPHVYQSPGRYPIEAWGIDSHGYHTIDQTIATAVIVTAYGTEYIEGSKSVLTGQTYTLQLFTNGNTFDTWSINWGDGTTSTGISSGATSVTHVFTTAPSTPDIVAQAISNGQVVANASLGLDPSYGTHGEAGTTGVNADALVTEADGTVVAVTSSGLVAFNADGTVDSSFGNDGQQSLPSGVTWTALTVGQNGELLVGGADRAEFDIAIYNPTSGTLNNIGSGNFGTGNGAASATAITFGDDEAVVVGGYVDSRATYPYSAAMAAFSFSNGSWGSSWRNEVDTSSPQNYAYSQAAVDPGDGYVDALRGGGFIIDQSTGGGQLLKDILQPPSAAANLTLSHDGNILLAGAYLNQFSPDGQPSQYFGVSGSVATTLSDGTTFQVISVLPQNNDSLLVLGQDSNGRYLLARYNSSGTLDTTFGSNGVETAIFPNSTSDSNISLVELSNGEYEIAGSNYNGTINIARLYGNNTIQVSGPPNVALNSISAATQNLPLTITANVTSGGGLDDVLTYQWEVLHNGAAVALPDDGITGGPNLTFTPTAGVDSGWSVSLTVSDTTIGLSRSVGPLQFSVGPAPLNIVGPNSVTRGAAVDYVTTAPWATNASWSAVVPTSTGTQTLSGNGLTFSFVPTTEGTANIHISATDSTGITQTANVTLQIGYAAPSVSIIGGSTGYAGHALTFAADVTQSPGENDDLSYTWNLTDPNGVSESLSDNTLPTFVMPAEPTPTGNPASATYLLALTVDDPHDGTTTPVQQSMDVRIVPDPAGPNGTSGFTFASVPDALDSEEANSPTSFGFTAVRYGHYFAFSGVATAEAAEPNGKIIVAGYVVSSDGWNNYANTGMSSEAASGGAEDGSDEGRVIFLARFNADLTLDTTFGPDQTGFDVETAPLPAGINLYAEVPLAMTINPSNGDIVVVGYGLPSDTGRWGAAGLDGLDRGLDGGMVDDGFMLESTPWVGEFLSSPRIISGGEMVEAGAADPAFNGGHLFVLTSNPNTSQSGATYWSGIADTVTTSGGSIFVGGTQCFVGGGPYTYGPYDADSGYGIVQDFLLFKLTPNGVQDNTFGVDGVAPYTWVSGSDQNLFGFPGNISDFGGIATVPIMTDIKSLIVTENAGEDKIVASGYSAEDPTPNDSNAPSSVGGDFEQIGFMVERYNADGTLDTSFGTDEGKTFTPASAFGGSGTSAYAAAAELLPDGNLLTVGIVSTIAPGSPWGVTLYHQFDGLYDVGAVEYDSDGQPINNGANGTILWPDAQREGPGSSGSETDWNNSSLLGGVTIPFDTLGQYGFEPDGSVLASLNDYYDLYNGWTVVHLNLDGTNDQSFGDAGTGSFAPPGGTYTADVSGPLLITADGIYATGSLMNTDGTNEPLIVRYEPSATGGDNSTANDTLALQAQSAANAIDLSWSDAVTGDGFEIARAQGDSSTFAPVAFVGPDQDDYSDCGDLADGTLYQYEIIPITGSAQTLGAPSNVVSATAWSTSGGNLVQALSVPVNGTVTSSDDLQSGDQYLVVVSGTTTLAPYEGPSSGSSYDADGAWWYVDGLPTDNGSTLDNQPFGVALAGYLGGPASPQVPSWGAMNVSNHIYATVITGNGNALTLQFLDADEANLGAGLSDQTVQVALYDLSSDASSATAITIRSILGPVAGGNGTPPTVRTATPVNILAASSGGGETPWSLVLIGPQGTTTLASSSASAGALPLAGQDVATIDPSRYPNGDYTLELLDGSGAVADSETVDIQSIEKLGDLKYSDTTAAFNTSTAGTVSTSVTYDSDSTEDSSDLGYGWNLNLLNADIEESTSPEAYDPSHFASEVMQPGDIVQLIAPPDSVQYGSPTYQGPGYSTYAFVFTPSAEGNGLYAASFPVATGGGGATNDPLVVVANSGSISTMENASAITLTYDSVGNQYLYNGVAFNPANPACNVAFRISSGGTTFIVNPVTGEIENVEAPSYVAYDASVAWNYGGNYDRNYGFNGDDSSNLNAGILYWHGVEGEPGYQTDMESFDGLGGSIGGNSAFGQAALSAGLVSDTTAMHVGDLVSLTVPMGGTNTFEFDPQAIEQNWSGIASQASIDYTPNFLSVSGSGATLSVIADPSSFQAIENSKLRLMYDSKDGEFLVPDIGFTFVGFDPADPVLGLAYQLTTAGYTYVINATTGRIESCSTSNGQVVYAISNTGNIVDGNGNNLLNIQWSGDPFNSQIQSLQVPGQNAVTFQYDEDGNLVGMTDQTGHTTTYSYADPANHLLSGVTNSLGVNVLSAQYAPATGSPADDEVTSVTDRNGVNIPISYNMLAGAAGVQVIADGAGDVTEAVYDEYGNVLRAINPLTQAADPAQGLPAALTGYLVTPAAYTYVAVQDGDTSPGVGDFMALQRIQNFAPMQISGSDPDDLRYTEQPPATTLLQETDYMTSGQFTGQVDETKQAVDFSGTLTVTINSNFEVVNTATGEVRPEAVITEIETPDPNAPLGTGYDINVQSLTCSVYDPSGTGELLDSVQSLLTPVSGDAGELLASGTRYQYNSNGQVIASYGVTADIAAQLVLNEGIVSGNEAVTNIQETAPYNSLSSNQYYTASGAGALAGSVEYSYNAAGQETFYAYSPSGQQILDYTYKTITSASGSSVNVWVGTTSVYNTIGQLTDTYSATYLDDPIYGTPTLNVLGSGVNGVIVNTRLNPIYAAPLRTVHNDYNSLGQLADSIDQYGGVTSYVYDANGQTIETLSPDGTEVLSVYDDKGEQIWQTNAFNPADGTSNVIATHSVYDDLGEVTETDQYLGTVINISGNSSSLGDAGTLLSSTFQFYDSKGQVVETDNSATGLRTGTIYYPNGQVAYTGTLLSTADNAGSADAWYNNADITTGPNPAEYFSSYTSTVSDQFDSNLGLFYTATTDQDGHTTDTYTDALGRTIRTVYPDGSFTQTLYSYGSTDLSALSVDGQTVANPSNWPGIPSGGYEEVSIAQRQAGDPPVITYDLYNVSGELIDVWEPAVTDGDSDSPTYDQRVEPQWQYEYDQAGNEIAQISPTGHQADGQGGSTGNTTTFGYDQNGNQVSQTLPDGEKETTTYNAYNQIATSTDFDGNTTAYTYFNGGPHAGQVVQVVYGAAAGSGKASETVTYTYNDLNQQATVTDASGTTTSTYDAAGNLVESDTPEGDIYYVFDLATGNHIETYTADTATLYGYDDQGRLTSVTVTELNGQTLSTPLVTSYTYDNAGNKLSETLPDGEVTTYTYDSLNRLIEQTEVQSGVTIFSQSYVLNDDGTRKSSHQVQLQPDGTYVITDNNWTYDADGRLTGESATFSESAAAGQSLPPNDLQVQQTLPGAYNPFSTYPGAASDGSVSLTWNGSNGFISSGMNAANPTSGDGAVLLDPAEGQTYGGNGTTQWVLIAEDGHGHQDIQSFTLSGGTFSPDGVLVGADFTSTPSLNFAQYPDQNYSDIYSYDLDNNRTADVHVGPGNGNSQSTTYSYNGDDELIEQTTTPQADSTSFSHSSSSYDANGSLTSQVGGSLASDDSFGNSSSSTTISSVASATTAGSAGLISTAVGVIGSANAVAQLPNGDILVAGYGMDSNGNQDIVLAAYHAAGGQLDTSFGTNGFVLTTIGYQAAADAVVVSNGHILIAGYGRGPTLSPEEFVVAEYTLSGSLNTAFGSGGIVKTAINNADAQANALTVLPNGNIVAAGFASNSSGQQEIALVEYSASGTMTGFGEVLISVSGDGDAAATSITQLPSGNLLIGGYGGSGEGYYQAAVLAEVNVGSGQLLTSFNATGMAVLPIGAAAAWNAIAVLANGDILAAGYGLDGRNVHELALAQYTAGGALASFGADGSGLVLTQVDNIPDHDVAFTGMVVQSNGQILLSGYGDVTPNNQQPLLAEFNANGTPDASFGAGGLALLPMDSTSPNGNSITADQYLGLTLLASGNIIAIGQWKDSAYDSGLLLGQYTSTSQATTTYTYDVRNKMVGYSDGSNTASYVYDDDGDRVAETTTTGGTTTTTLYLTDTQNPTGYDQPLEAKSSPTAIPTNTYLIGDRVLGQANGTGQVSYLLTDGHGSTQQMTDAAGNITAVFRYDAYGDALNFVASEAGTVFLFGGDAVFDAVSGLYMHGDGTRDTDGFEFTQRDTMDGSNDDPLSLHKYLYADADPIGGTDPSGNNDENNSDSYGDDSDDEYSGFLGGLLGDIAEQQTATYNLAEAIGNNWSNAEITADTLAATAQPTTQGSGMQVYVLIWHANLMYHSVGHCAMFNAATDNVMLSEFPAHTRPRDLLDPPLSWSDTHTREGRNPDEVYSIWVPNAGRLQAAVNAYSSMKWWYWDANQNLGGNQTNCTASVEGALNQGGVPVGQSPTPNDCDVRLSTLSQNQSAPWSVTRLAQVPALH